MLGSGTEASIPEAVKASKFFTEKMPLSALTFSGRSPHPAGIGGADFYTKLIVSRNALDFNVDDPLTIEVLLHPDNVVALVGMTD